MITNIFSRVTKTTFSLALMLFAFSAFSQSIILNQWQFRKTGSSKWYKATVPGSVHTDLLQNKLLASPFYAGNEAKLQWIDSVDWEYQTSFVASNKMLQQPTIFIEFEGIDTYADVFLNGKKLGTAYNMFRQWTFDIKKQIVPGRNNIKVVFQSAIHKTANLARENLPIVLPDDARVYARKAQYQFNWDWGPKFVSAGLWKPVKINFGNERTVQKIQPKKNEIELVQKKDSIGHSFYFSKNGKPIFMKGANWIPANAFPAAATKDDYRALLVLAKEAGMNMMRVWGGGIYEQDYFYELCDSLDIMVWQDYMFACRMYPGDESFFANVKEEVKQQVERLSKYNCIVIWCGNNEVDEGWHHWGWQNQFNLHGNDSAKVWHDYVKLFRDSLNIWTKTFDPLNRPYISTSPQYGWGNPKSYASGDSHYWGLWWGLEGWEKFKTHTGRFVSEWGMQAMPNYSTVKKYVPEDERYLYSPSVNAHQKAGNGFMKLNHYINQYFYDTTRLSKLSLEEYTYVSQCLQYYILKNSLATHISKQPVNMGSLIWQLNDCWPVTSWSLIDFYHQPKAGYYAAKNAFLKMDTHTDKVYPKHLTLSKPNIQVNMERTGFSIVSDVEAYYVFVDFGDYNKYVSDNYFNLKAGQKIFIPFRMSNEIMRNKPFKILSLYNILSK
ncbi:MAG TPA: hypothetical protein PK504_02635 [Ferruginibacter sp.]|nr:hypothetical protein [Ferruginibacter sp.]HRE62190.1 hypothetical protein [Ferruginibacter sp.]